jgi:hypothetical protein
VTYPEDFQSTPDEDGDIFRISTFVGAVEDETALHVYGEAYVPRKDIPRLVSWLQAHYDATLPEIPVKTGALIRATLKNKSAQNSEERLYSRMSGGGTVWVNMDNQSLYREDDFDTVEILFEGVSDG